MPARPEAMNRYAETSEFHAAEFHAASHPLTAPITVDVAIVGNGLAALTAALALHRTGRRVVILSAGRLIESSTSPAPQCHDFVEPPYFSRWYRDWGLNRAAEIVALHRAAIDELESRCQAYQNCHFQRVPSYFVAESGSQLTEIEQQCAVGRALRTECWFSRETPLPFHCAGAMRIDSQGKLHLDALLRGMAAEFRMLGGEIYENTPCFAPLPGAICSIETERATVRAEAVYLASRSPLPQASRLYSAMVPLHHYLVAIRTAQQVDDAIFIEEGTPRRLLSRAMRDDPTRLLIRAEYWGQQQGNQSLKFDELACYAAKRLSVRAVEAKFSQHQFVAPDGLPVAGRVPGAENENIFMTAGMGASELPWGIECGLLIADLIQGRKHALAEHFDPARLLSPKEKRGELFESAAPNGGSSERRQTLNGNRMPREAAAYAPLHARFLAGEAFPPPMRSMQHFHRYEPGHAWDGR